MICGDFGWSPHLQNDIVPLLGAVGAKRGIVIGAGRQRFDQVLAEELIWLSDLHRLHGCVWELLAQQMGHHLHIALKLINDISVKENSGYASACGE